MSTDHISTALHELADGVEDAAGPPATIHLWGRGRRRRVRARVAVSTAAAAVLALLASVAWPAGAPRATVPAEGVRVVDGRTEPTSFPQRVALPPGVPTSARPGVTALVVGEEGKGRYAVSPTGSMTRLPFHAGSREGTALSRDGRWLAGGAELHDLVRGSVVQTTGPLPDRGLAGRAWWSPDSTRVLVDVSAVSATGAGTVVSTDGMVVDVPEVEPGLLPVLAGWLDGDTVLALLDMGQAAERLEVYTWRVGDPAWTRTGTVVSWRGAPADADDGVSSVLTASLSPDSRLLLLTASVGRDGTAGSLGRTRGTVVDVASGAVLGMPEGGRWPALPVDPGTFAEWEGWGCRPAWFGGLPVVTDDGVHDPRAVGQDLVTMSPQLGGCPVFAGDELHGSAVPNSAAVWRERVWVYVLPAMGLLLLLSVGWWASRRRGRWRERPEWLPMIWQQRY